MVKPNLFSEDNIKFTSLSVMRPTFTVFPVKLLLSRDVNSNCN